MWYPHWFLSLLLHLACIQVPSIHKHDLVTLLEATNQHSQFPCVSSALSCIICKLCESPTTSQHQVFSYWFICLLAHSLLPLKAEHQSNSLSRKESQPKDSCLLARGPFLWKMPQRRMEVSARQTGPLPCSVWSAAFGRESPQGAYGYEPVDGSYTHTQAHCRCVHSQVHTPVHLCT